MFVCLLLKPPTQSNLYFLNLTVGVFINVNSQINGEYTYIKNSSTALILLVTEMTNKDTH